MKDAARRLGVSMSLWNSMIHLLARSIQQDPEGNGQWQLSADEKVITVRVQFDNAEHEPYRAWRISNFDTEVEIYGIEVDGDRVRVMTEILRHEVQLTNFKVLYEETILAVTSLFKPGTTAAS